MSFKVGDRVRRINGNVPWLGKIGTVVSILPGAGIGVRFDHPCVGLHDLDGRCEHLHGWWSDRENIELLKIEFDSWGNKV